MRKAKEDSMRHSVRITLNEESHNLQFFGPE